MGVRAAVVRLAARSAHVLVVEVPGAWEIRAAVERAALDRGWQLAHSPADSDVLAVCGEPGPRLADTVDQVWHQMPGPRVRVDVVHRGDAAAALEQGKKSLLDAGRHRADARNRPSGPDLIAEFDRREEDMDHGDAHEGMEHEDMDHGGMDHGDMDHGGMDHGDMDHEGMDHGDMEMAPGGIPLADGARDRDGLQMDVLTVPLGPVLPYWPAGLVVRCSVQGDVITDASVEFLDADTRIGDDPAPHPAQRLDHVVAVLALAGWGNAAEEARAIRDEVLRGNSGAAAGERFVRLDRRIRRSRLLRWSMRGIGVVDAEDVDCGGLPRDLMGDSHERLLAMMDRTMAGLTGQDRAAEPPCPAVSPEHIARLVTGLDLAAARLMVASLGSHVMPASADRNSVSHA